MSQLLSELDGLDSESSNVVSIFATNKPDVMDPALLNRCSAIEVPVPDDEAKREILQVHTRQIDLKEDVDLELLAEQLDDNFTGRDIKQIVKQAAITALEGKEDLSFRRKGQYGRLFEEAVKDLKEGNLGVEKDFLADENVTPHEMFA